MVTLSGRLWRGFDDAGKVGQWSVDTGATQVSPFSKMSLFSRQNHNCFPSKLEVGVNAFGVTVETSTGASEKVFKAVRLISFIWNGIFSSSHFALNLTQGPD